MMNALELRIADVVRAYDEQGNHRTGTAVDAASLEWLAGLVERAGLRPQFEPVSLERVDVRAAFLRTGGRLMGGVPLFDGTFTPPAGIAGSLGLFGSASDIGIAAIGRAVPADWAPIHQPSPAQIRASNHKAVVLVTYGNRPGLALQNASSFTVPKGPPALQVSSEEGAWLKALAMRGGDETASVVIDAKRTATQSHNLVVELAGSQLDLEPVLITTPRTGWWQCASERGGGLACWLELLSALASSERRRTCHFAAFTGHELGLMGGEAYARRRSAPASRAHSWMHFGANIGAAGKGFRLQASDMATAQKALQAFAAAGEAAVERTAPDVLPRGEAIFPHRTGIRYVAPICASDVFHHPGDRWPEVIDVSAVARCARAFTTLAVEMINENIR